MDASATPAAAKPPSWRRVLAEHAGAAGAAALAAVLLLQLWRADLRVPFDYHGDAPYFAMLVKAVVDGGWCLTVPLAGAPGVLEMHDFPQVDTFHYVLVKVLALFSSSWALVFNLYFLLGFVLITLAALAVLRHFRVAYLPALAVSLLYAFLPTRLLKGEVHYFLDIYFEVPLAILVALWACGAEPLRLRSRRGAVAVAICALTAATGIYYAFFAGVLILCGGAWAALARRTSRHVVAALMLVSVIVAGLGLQAIPAAAYRARHGANAEVAARQPQEAEVFGLRITQLLMPTSAHRVPALRQLKLRYDAATPFPGETSMTSLGVVASVGFLALLALLLLPPAPGRPRAELLRALAALNLLALLLGTAGGFGALFAWLVTPMIRGYARIHVFNAFFALFAVALLIERAGARRAWLAPVLAAGVLALGLFDQVTPAAVRGYAKVKALYDSDAAFVRTVEATVPPRAMIFLLPHQSFPEGPLPPGGHASSYDLLRPYFHSRTLRWSFPAMLGREAAAWSARTAALPAGRMLQDLADAGFQGIVVDRLAYADGGAAAEAALRAELGFAPVASGDGTLAFYNLVEDAARRLAGVPDAELQRRRAQALHPLFIKWRDGAYAAEQDASGTFRWCQGATEIEIDNDAGAPRDAVLSLHATAARPPARLDMAGDLVSQTFALDADGTAVIVPLHIPPGRHVIQLRSDSRPALAPRDPRTLVWRADSITLDELPRR